MTGYPTLKRGIDIVVAGAGLVSSAPLLVLLAGLGVWAHGWPPWFTQSRPGLDAKLFRIIKLRSMTNARDGAGRLLPDAERLTRFGRFLRASSLDELPELINVLRGEMSLVGPRPLLVSYLDRYSSRQARRHEVRPGITGLAQVSGRNGLDWVDRFELDVFYVENMSLRLDLEILLRTLATVVRREGINEAGQATQTEFQRSPP
ncbi:MAG: sugar transferase [Polyangiaceae bacterium]